MHALIGLDESNDEKQKHDDAGKEHEGTVHEGDCVRAIVCGVGNCDDEIVGAIDDEEQKENTLTR